MKKLLRSMLILCAAVSLLSVMMIPAQTASGQVESCLQLVSYYNPSTEEWDEYEYPCVLVRNEQNNLLVTAVAPKSGWITAFTITSSDKWQPSEYVGEGPAGLHIYMADASCGEKDGFLPLGAVTRNEAIRYVGYDNEWKPLVVETVALEYQSGVIVPKDPVSTKYTVAIVNSKDEVCGIEFGGQCIAFGPTTEESFYGNTGDQETAPTEPPVTESPTEDPLVTEPPATEPSVTTPSATEPQHSNLAQDNRKPVDLEDIDKLYSDAVVQKKPSQAGIVAVAVLTVLILVLIAAIVVVKRRKKMKINNEDLNEAEEGTVLADVPADTGLRLQFRNGKRIAVKRSFTIGRASDNDIVIPKTSSAVSGRHCEIVVQNGAVYLRDLGSTNGTFINGKRLVTGQLVQLLPGMMVGLGDPNGAEAFAVVVSQK